MDAIFKKEIKETGDVYVAVTGKGYADEKNVTNNSQFIFDVEHNAYLFGGRVEITGHNGKCRISIDGISIVLPKYYNYTYNSKIIIGYNLSFEQCAAYLNQIENLGVDTFLDNYKKVIEEYKTDVEKQIEDLKQQMSSEDNQDKKSTLTSLQEVFYEISCLLVALHINLNINIDNHIYVEAYDSIINQFF